VRLVPPVLLVLLVKLVHKGRQVQLGRQGLLAP
jgi:hypothetical protein